ncbi:MAG: ribbon-helix-helix protein, CopG family [Candidatus Caldarchaeum sp.]
MATLSQRLEIRLEPDVIQRLRQEARRRDISLTQLVREAIDLLLQQDREAKQQAAEALFQVGAPVDDWEKMKQEIIEARLRTGIK